MVHLSFQSRLMSGVDTKLISTEHIAQRTPCLLIFNSLEVAGVLLS